MLMLDERPWRECWKGDGIASLMTMLAVWAPRDAHPRPVFRRPRVLLPRCRLTKLGATKQKRSSGRSSDGGANTLMDDISVAFDDAGGKSDPLCCRRVWLGWCRQSNGARLGARQQAPLDDLAKK